ncbi:MAG: PorT family protein [Fibromonadales bacterium]|nr:PorT family protein [Fibromonadales bacterium]
MENKIRIGIGSKVAFGVADLFINEAINPNLEIGIIAKIPIIRYLSFSPELNLAKRDFSFVSVSYDCGGYACSSDWRYYYAINGFAASIPMLIQIMPFGGPLFYLESGIQLDFLFAAEVYETDFKYYARSYYYTKNNPLWGKVLGFGWNISELSALGIRSVIGITDVVKEEDVKYFSLGLGLNYFF